MTKSEYKDNHKVLSLMCNMVELAQTYVCLEVCVLCAAVSV